MKTLRLACLLALALPLLAASSSPAQYNNSGGPHPAYPAYNDTTPQKPGYGQTALRRASTTRSTKSRGSGCDTGCATCWDTGHKTGCDTGCDVAPRGCDAKPACGCRAKPVCGCGAKPACGCGADSGCGCDAAPAASCDSTPACGCKGGHKVCKLVKVEYEIEAICYGVRCKDMCVPGCGGKCTKTECIQCGGAGCDCCGNGASCQIRYPTGKPGPCAKVRTVKHLVKYKTTKKVCGFRWEVVDAGCGGCDACGCDTGFDFVPATDKSEGDPFGDDFPPIPIPQDPNA